jgi:hypothetical protein
VTVGLSSVPEPDDLPAAHRACATRIVDRAHDQASRRAGRPLAMASGAGADDDDVFSQVVRRWSDEGVEVLRLATWLTRSMLPAPQAPPSEKRKYRALHCLAIGIDQYDDLDELENAANDALGMAFVLESKFEFENIETMTNREATRGAIKAKLDEMEEQIHEDDLFVFFFAGHGCTLEGDDGYEYGYIAPVEAVAGDKDSLIGYDELWAWGADMRARHVLYVFDACFSGLATIVTTGPGAIQRGSPGDARRTITAGKADQEVFDAGFRGPDERLHSIFSSHVLWALWRDLPESRDNKPFSAGLLYETIVEAVQKQTQGQQRPAHGALPGDADGRILLIPSSGEGGTESA